MSDQFKSHCTPEEHEQGWKDVLVHRRDGSEMSVRLTAPDYRAARRMALAFNTSHDAIDVLVECMTSSPGAAPPSGDEAMKEFFARRAESRRLIDWTIAMADVGTLCDIAFELTWGVSELKKMLESLKTAIDKATATPGDAPK